MSQYSAEKYNKPILANTASTDLEKQASKRLLCGKSERYVIKEKVMEMEVTWGRAAKVWWSYLWRNIVAVICAMFIGGIIGGMLGFVMGMLGVSLQAITFVTAPIGMLVGLAISIVPIKPILGKNYGEFRLVLVRTDTSEKI